jgi:Tol biopolymer transport system component
VEQELNGETPHSYNNTAPTWSPDGSQIAFLTDRTGNWEIWVMNADGSNQRPLFPAGLLDSIRLQYSGMDERMLSWR